MNALEAQAAPSPVILTRIIIGINKIGGTVTVADVVDTGSSADLLSWRKMDTVDDFIILKDFFIRIDPHALNEGVTNSFAYGTSISQVIKYSKNFSPPLKMSYATGLDTPTRNNIFLLAISTATGAVLNIETRTRFTDS